MISPCFKVDLHFHALRAIIREMKSCEIACYDFNEIRIVFLDGAASDGAWEKSSGRISRIPKREFN